MRNLLSTEPSGSSDGSTEVVYNMPVWIPDQVESASGGYDGNEADEATGGRARGQPDPSNELD
jgi:hypothetical protein